MITKRGLVPETQNSPSRRRHARVPLPCTVRIFRGTRAVGFGVLEDASSGGARVVTGKPVAKGRVISLMADLPGSRPFVAFAQVTRHEVVTRGPHREHVLGLTFVNLPSEELKRLEVVIARSLAERAPTVEFIDTDDGQLRRLVMGEGRPLVAALTSR